MKSVILIACLIASASCAPQKSAGLEREGQRSEKLQFSPSDAQVYSSGIVPETVVVDRVVPSYSGYGSSYGSRVNSYGVAPYGSGLDRTSVTTSQVTGLPVNTVYEHVGQSHSGHLANAHHIRRPSHLNWGNQVPGVSAISTSSLNRGIGYSNNQIQYINGQPAQYVNGQWYYLDAAQVPAYEGVYGNPVNRQSSVVSDVKRYSQVGQWQSGILGARPNYQRDNKWYTKTNNQPIVSPFYGQPQYTPQYSPVASHHTKSRAVPRPIVQVEGERSDW